MRTIDGGPSAEVLQRVRRYRQAARIAVRSEATVKARCLGLLEIADMARAEPDPIVKLWSERAIWEESKTFLGMDDAEPELPAPSFERRVRKLRSQGHAACPTCLYVLPTDDDLHRWSRLRSEHARLLEIRESAVADG